MIYNVFNMFIQTNFASSKFTARRFFSYSHWEVYPSLKYVNIIYLIVPRFCKLFFPMTLRKLEKIFSVDVSCFLGANRYMYQQSTQLHVL